MKNIFVWFLLMANFSFGQLPCGEIKEIQATTLLKSGILYQLSGNDMSFSFLIDLLDHEVLTIFHAPNKEGCSTATFYSEIENNEDVDPALILDGYCFCNTCTVFSKSLHKISLFKGFNYFFQLKANSDKKLITLEKERILDSELLVNDDNLLLEDKVFKQGDVLKLDKIFFAGGSEVYLDKSQDQLDQLLRLMKKYKSLKISIEGHVNGLSNDLEYYDKLSEGRAYAIRRFLMENGINSSRIKSVGFGNKRMLYPKPKSPEEMEFNRRVEIRILEFS